MAKLFGSGRGSHLMTIWSGVSKNTRLRSFELYRDASDQEYHSPTEGLATEQRFRQPQARLFPFLGRKVRTPKGPGTLIQVFAERVTVLLDSERDKCRFFTPTQIEPVSTE
jgi:hypothetical protein